MNNLIVLFGEEKYLIDLETKKIVEKILGVNTDEYKVSYYDLNETSINDVLMDAEMMPFFSDKKVIVCDNCFFLTGSNQKTFIEHNLDELLKYIENTNELTTIIFKVIDNKLDNRKKIVKELKKRAVVKEFTKLKDQELVNYINEFLKQKEFKMDRNAIIELISRTYDNLGIVFNELEKLMIYKIDKKQIDINDVYDLIDVSLNDNIFEFIDAVVQRNIEKALYIYDDLLIVNEEPIKIIVMLADQLRLIYQTKKLYSMGYNEKDISQKLGIHPYRIKLSNRVFLDEKTLINLIEKLADLDINIKTGKINKNIGLEMFLLNL